MIQPVVKSVVKGVGIAPTVAIITDDGATLNNFVHEETINY